MTISNYSFEDPDSAGSFDKHAIANDWAMDGTSTSWDWAVFDSEMVTTEDFEAGYSSNQDRIEDFAPSDIEAAVFDTTTPEVYEDFEEEWSSNEDRTEVMGATASHEFDVAAETYEDFDEEYPSRHLVADYTLITEQIPELLSNADLRTHANELKAKYNTHIASATVHDTADSTNTLTSLDASDEASTITLVTEMWTDCWAHMIDVGLAWHRDVPWDWPKPTVDEYPPSDYSDCAVLLDYLTVNLNRHFQWASCSGRGYGSTFVAWKDYTWSYLRTYSAPFDTAVEEVENFEEEWGGNENRKTTFTGVGVDLELATFQKDPSGTENFESFEEQLTLNIAAGPDAAGTSRVADPTGVCRVIFTGTWTGTLKVQIKRQGFSEWLDYDTATSNGTTNLDLGVTDVRIYTVVISSGTPTAVLHYRDIDLV